MQTTLLNKSIKVLLLFILLFTALHFGASFLVPITFASFFAFLLLPAAMWLQSKGVNKGLASLLSVLLLVLACVSIVWLLSWQISHMANDMETIKENFSKKSEQVANYINRTFGFSSPMQKQFIKQQTSSVGQAVSSVIASVGTLLTKTLIVFIYIFLFIYYRTHFRKFMLQMVGKDKQQETMGIIDSAGKVTQRYITGLFSMIFCLWIMYGIGFSIIGVKNAIFFAILCGLLELIPYVGNLTGNAITIVGIIIQGGSNMMIVEELIVYSVVQFIQSYLLAPLIVGKVVRINPIATIVGLVGGEIVWGVPGMVLVIPLLGITKIIFDHVEPLKPFGFLLGEEREANKKVIERIRRSVRRH
jgi:predicted PurR-regulated permease PerM